MADHRDHLNTEHCYFSPLLMPHNYVTVTPGHYIPPNLSESAPYDTQFYQPAYSPPPPYEAPGQQWLPDQPMVIPHFDPHALPMSPPQRNIFTSSSQSLTFPDTVTVVCYDIFTLLMICCR